MKPSPIRFVFFFLVTIFCVSCSYAPFQVKPRVNLPPESFPHSATRESIRVSALAVRDEDETARRFDGNLLLFDILPVQVQIANQGTAPLTAKRLKFRLRDSLGRQYEVVPVKKVLDRQMKFYGYRAYSARGYQEVKETYGGHAFPEKPVIPAGSFTQGVVFFNIPGAVHQVSSQFVLEIQGLTAAKEPLTLALQ